MPKSKKSALLTVKSIFYCIVDCEEREQISKQTIGARLMHGGDS